MSLRKGPAGNLKKGMYFMVNDEPCLTLGVEHSKSGKHGHAKNRVACVGLFDKKKRSIVFSSGGMVDIPEINKRNGQITDVSETIITIMDLESYETFDCSWPSEDVPIKKLKELLTDHEKIGETQAEYWDLIGKKVITRVMFQ